MTAKDSSYILSRGHDGTCERFEVIEVTLKGGRVRFAYANTFAGAQRALKDHPSNNLEIHDDWRRYLEHVRGYERGTDNRAVVDCAMALRLRSEGYLAVKTLRNNTLFGIRYLVLTSKGNALLAEKEYPKK